MTDDDHDTHDDYLDRQLASCTHERVIYRPVGGHAMGWTPVWVCEMCCAEFVPRDELLAALAKLPHD